MLFKQILSEGLAQYSYLIGDRVSGQCLVIDPRRDVDIYLDIAQSNGMRIVNILETHIHADFISGSLELAARSGASISLSAVGEVGFEHVPLEDGDIIQLGDLSLQVIHAPGHTPEHICFLISGGGKSEKPWGLISGDLLFSGEVGRPDLLGEEIEEELVHDLYQSLQKKILNLGDEIVVYPGHGQGSPCGASIGARPVTTIGYEKSNNPLLGIEDEALFIRTVRDSLSPAPAYYKRVKRINTAGPAVIGNLPNLYPLTAREIKALVEDEDSLIIDAREISAFGGGHIGGAIHVGLRNSFPIWAGEMIDQIFPEWSAGKADSGLKIGLVLPDEESVKMTQLHLFRIGIDNIRGYLRGGFRAWFEAGYPFAQLDLISVHGLQRRIKEGEAIQLVDVRTKNEWNEGHIPGAKHLYLTELLERAQELDQTLPVVTYCGTGFRASIASSILKKKGFAASNVPGSIVAWRNAGFDEEIS